MPQPRVVILGGGLSGIGAALGLAAAGWRHLTIVERGRELGGLAGSFEIGDRFYPLAYHHILHRDRTLLFMLDRIGALPSVRWRRIAMLFRQHERFYNLATPAGFLRFPMPLSDKVRFTRLMARCFRKSNWDDWQDRSASDLVDAWGGPGVREVMFEPLTRLKFDLPCAEVSGAWLGARLHFREGSAPLGYIPGTTWTKVLCDGLTVLLGKDGVSAELERSVAGLRLANGRVVGVDLDDGRHLACDLVVSTLPTEVYRHLAPADATPHLAAVRYTAIVSAIFATRQVITPDFYWMNLPSLDHAACGVFRLESLNPTIGAPGDSCFNFITHVPSRMAPFFQRSDAEILDLYAADFRRLFGSDLQPFWTRLVRLPMYSPVFDRGYRNPPARSATFENVFFAGNYRTFPSIASTGTAIGSGLETAGAMLASHGHADPLREELRRFRWRGMGGARV